MIKFNNDAEKVREFLLAAAEERVEAERQERVKLANGLRGRV
jgi:hypothetical protein